MGGVGFTPRGVLDPNPSDLFRDNGRNVKKDPIRA